MTEPTFSLVLTAAQAHQLFRLVGIGELALTEHYRNGWQHALKAVDKN